MRTTLSSNTQAILLLTAPLVAGQGKSPASPLSPVEYNRLARWLQKHGREPADLVSNGGWNELKDGSLELDRRRLGHLLGRGFSLSQAVKRWQARAIWVVSRADVDYPRRLKNHLGVLAPPLLYGCGERAVLDGGGLAVVGSRNVSDELIGYTEDVGRLAAKAHRSVVSGGARGIDRAAMRGALEAGGVVAGILADSLERAVMRREHREALMSGRLVLISPYDPAARFHVGHAMQRNKLIYALADAALVVSSDYGKGGTWTGAVEQLEKLRFVPVYVRADGKTGKGLDELRRRGARPWPNPTAPETLRSLLAAASVEDAAADHPDQEPPPPDVQDERTPPEANHRSETKTPAAVVQARSEEDPAPSAVLFANVRELLLDLLDAPRSEAEIADTLEIQKSQARAWLARLVTEGALEKLPKPVRYRTVGPLFK